MSLVALRLDHTPSLLFIIQVEIIKLASQIYERVKKDNRSSNAQMNYMALSWVLTRQTRVTLCSSLSNIWNYIDFDYDLKAKWIQKMV